MTFTIHIIEDHFPHLEGNPEAIKLIVRICNKTIDSTELETMDCNRLWINQCFHKPSYRELSLNALNYLLEGHGVESINNPNVFVDNYYHDCVIEYVNVGDSYYPTIYLDTINQTFGIACYEDIMQIVESIEDNNS